MALSFIVNARLRLYGLALVEHLLIVACVLVAAALRFSVPGSVPVPTAAVVWRASFIGVVLQLWLHYADLYDLRRLSARRDLFTALLHALGAASFTLAFLYYWVPTLVIGRGVFILASTFTVAVVAGWRIVFEWLATRAKPAERLLIVGTSAAAVDLAGELFDRRAALGVELVGFVDPDPRKVGSPVINPGIIGTVEQIPDIIRQRHVDRVVVSLADARGKLPMDALLAMKLNRGVRFDHLASVYEQYTGKIAVENLRPSWLIFSEGFRSRRSTTVVKRVFDVIVASIGLILAIPVMALVALMVRLTSPGPALFRQRRVGKDGHGFVMLKFRSMRVDAEAETGAVWSRAGDPRVTPFGRLLRRTRLDELPQLWNVVVGDMSFVGPRPERPEFVASLTEQIPFYGQRHVIQPGLTGWAQVRHPYGASIADALQKLQYELFYIKHRSLAFDLFILLETIKTVLTRQGS
jgi:sugar transferase (PEP-CTERM system associated)